MNYQELIHECEESGVTVEEYPLQSHDGLYCNNLILINQSLGDNTAKKCILAESSYMAGRYYDFVYRYI